MTASAVLLTGSVLTFAGPEPMESKDKMVMAPPPVCDPRWYISIGGSVDFHFGDFSSKVDEFVFGNEVFIESRDWGDVYDFGWNIQGEVGYVLNDHIELFGGFSYHRADSNSVVQEDAFDGFGSRLELRWGDYESFGGELGLRYFFFAKGQEKLRPFVSIAGGAAHVDDIGLHVEGLNFPSGTIYNGAFYDSGIVGTATALFGVEYNVTCHFAVRIDAGIRWESGLDQNDRDFPSSLTTAISFQEEIASTLHRLNNEEAGHFTVPVTVSAVFRF